MRWSEILFILKGEIMSYAPNSYRNINYGFNQPLNQAAPQAIVANRAPTGRDIGYPLLTLWDYAANNQVYVLSSVVAGVATWLQVVASGGTGNFTSLTVTPGLSSLSALTSVGTANINATGTASTNIGNATGSLTFVGNNNTLTGNLTASSYLSTPTLYATGDLGGAALTVGFSDVSVLNAGGTGAYSVVSATGSTARNSAGFIKVYIGVTPYYIPVFDQTN
jgi:hypothetical protein